MRLFPFGKKDDDAPRRRGANARSARGEPRRRPARSAEASGRESAYSADAMLLDPTLPEKQRARRRLVGAIALVIAAVVVLPMILDSHPKPVTDDIAIDIPSRPANVPARARDDMAGDEDANADKQAAPGSASGPAVAGVTPVAPANPGADTTAAEQRSSKAAAAHQRDESPDKAGQSVTTGKAAQFSDGQAAASEMRSGKAAKAQAGGSERPQAVTQSGSPSAAADASRLASSSKSQARSEPTKSAQAATQGVASAGSGTPAAPPGARFAVQLGVFSDATAARRWESKLKSAGVPAYTENRKQADGSMRTLLRAGPFPDRAAASAAIAKVREAGLTSNAAQ
jgi:DedD protein